MARPALAIFDIDKAPGYRLPRMGLIHAAYRPAPEAILLIKIISHPSNPTGEMESPGAGW